MSFTASVEELVANSDNLLAAKAPNWGRVSLTSVARIVNGFPLKAELFSEQGDTPVIRIRDVTAGRAGTFYKGSIPKGYWVEPGDIVIGMDGDFISRIWEGERALLNQRVCKLEPDEARIDKRFLAYVLPGYLGLINEATHSITVKHLSSKTIGQIPLPYPPLAEQRRIVAKLDALFARLQRARAELERVPRLVERTKQAVLEKETSPNASERSDCWQSVRVRDIGDVQIGRQRSPKHHSGEHMRPYIRAANITWKGLALSDVLEMNFPPRDLATFQLQAGDILLSEASGSASEVGKPAIWRNEISDCCFQNTVIRVRPRQVTPEYLYFVFLRYAHGGQFTDASRGIGIHHLGSERLANLQIPLPPLAEQAEIVRRIEAAFARIDRMAAEAARATALLDRLEQATLSKAFRGELLGAEIPEVAEDAA